MYEIIMTRFWSIRSSKIWSKIYVVYGALRLVRLHRYGSSQNRSVSQVVCYKNY